MGMGDLSMTEKAILQAVYIIELQGEIAWLRGLLQGIRILADDDLQNERGGFYTQQIEAATRKALKPAQAEEEHDG